MPLALIAALAGKKQVIGKNGDLPWHFRSDLKFFKDTTMGHAVLMGRKTYQSILNRLGKPLPGRDTIVLTRDKNFKDDRVTVLHTLEEIDPDFFTSKKWLYVIGGAEVYEQTLRRAQKLYLTHIEQEVEGDAFFPALDSTQWVKEGERAEEENGVTLRFCTYAQAAA
jgi:dihydrofolate reductase